MLIHVLLTTLFLLPCYKSNDVDNKDAVNIDLPVILSFSHSDVEKSKYDISDWVKQLHLQQCVFVEIGEGFCALFVELRSTLHNSTHSSIFEFFMGVCNCETLRSWILCSPEVLHERKSDCIFNEAVPNANTSARVHRRLCDVTFLSFLAPPCDCKLQLAGEQLHKTEGFPTCFQSPLPQSICSPRGVCGVSMCSTTTVQNIHAVRCDPNCRYRQPFCEDPGPWTSKPITIKSSWSVWSEPKCNVTCGSGVLTSTSTCLNDLTGTLALDCIGPGTFCCTSNEKPCSCKVVITDDRMLLYRFTDPCFNTDSCDDDEKMRILGRDFMVAEDEGDILETDESDRNYLDSISNGELFDYGGAPSPIQRRLSGRRSIFKNDETVPYVNPSIDEASDKSSAQGDDDYDDDDVLNKTPKELELDGLYDQKETPTGDEIDDDDEFEDQLPNNANEFDRAKKSGRDGDFLSYGDDNGAMLTRSSLASFNYLLLYILLATIG